jgi:hypothetical protein
MAIGVVGRQTQSARQIFSRQFDIPPAEFQLSLPNPGESKIGSPFQSLFGGLERQVETSS